jgi:hypothetical protein
VKSKGQVNYEGFHARSPVNRDPWEKQPEHIRLQWEHAADEVIDWHAQELARNLGQLTTAVAPIARLVVKALRDILAGRSRG